jgi:hypothetical protein
MPRKGTPAEEKKRSCRDGCYNATHPMPRFTPEQLIWILGLALTLLGLALYRMFFLF